MSLVLRRLLVCALFFRALIAGKGEMAQMALPSLSDPGVSTDGQEIAFVSSGDIWTVAAALMFALVSWDSL
jgi:tricorn protease